jgi:hypothetical protein
MLQQLGNPLSIFDIGMKSRDGFDVLSIDDPDFQGGFEQVVNGLPV